MIRRRDIARGLAKGPATLGELLERFPSVGKGTSNFIRSEVFHMRKAGLVEKVGETWTLTEKGRRYVQEARRCGPAERSLTTFPWNGAETPC